MDILDRCETKQQNKTKQQKIIITPRKQQDKKTPIMAALDKVKHDVCHMFT